MNDHEWGAWRRLVELGATKLDMGGSPALDLRGARPRTERDRSDFIGSLVEVVGRSGSVRRHVDRRGNAVFVVTDDPRAEGQS